MPSIGLAAAAGAGQGLNDVLNRMMEEAKLKQLTDSTAARQAETNRSNLATEGFHRDQLAAMERERVSRDAMTQGEHDRVEGRAVRDDSRQAMDTIPAGTVLPETDPTVKMANQAGFGSLLRGVKARPAVDVGPLQEEDQGQAIPVDSRIKLKSFNQVKDASLEADKAAGRTEQAARDAETIRHNRAVEAKPPAASIQIIPTNDGLVSVDKHNLRAGASPVNAAGGGQLQPIDPAQVRNRRDMASAVGSHFDDANQLIDEADSKGLLGPIKGRTFAEFLAGQVGSTGNAENDALLGDLRTSMSMIRSGTASLHGRAGANAGIARDIQTKMDEGHMSAAELKGSLKALRSWVDKYASKGSGTGTAPAASGSGAKVIRYGLDGKVIPPE